MKYRKQWARLLRVLGWEGADSRTLGTFYREVVQAALLFGSETWVISQNIARMLGGFNHRVIHQMTGRQPRCKVDGSQVYSPLEEATAAEGLEEVKTYVACRYNKVT